MKILSISHVYNESLYLEDSYNYLKSIGVNEFAYIDNMSSDDSMFFLQRMQDIFWKVFSTYGAFNLGVLQKELLGFVKLLAPDWVIYTDPDLYYVFDGTLAEEIEKAEAQGCNQISTMCWGALNTGEEYKLPLRKHFFHGVPWKRITRVSKWNESVSIEGDNVFIDNPKVYESNGLVINYGGCKSSKDQDEKLSRIIKARKQGQRNGIGCHYEKYKKLGYKWDKKDLTDLRTEPLLKKLIDY